MEPPKRLIFENEQACGSSDEDSLFDEPRTGHTTCTVAPLALSSLSALHLEVAQLTAPPIPGFFFCPNLIPYDLADHVFDNCLRTYFSSPNVDQVMLFGLASSKSSCLPLFLQELLGELDPLLRPLLPPEIHRILFKNEGARQAIINLYEPGEGITPHVDLLRRFGDGIIGVSLGSSCAMQFQPCSDSTAPARSYNLYLPARSVIVLTGDARYEWTHGIEARTCDRVEGEPTYVDRGVRVSVTFRWLLPGANIVGKDE